MWRHAHVQACVYIIVHTHVHVLEYVWKCLWVGKYVCSRVSGDFLYR